MLIFIALLLLMCLWKISVCVNKGEHNTDYLCPANTGCIKGLLAFLIILHHLSQKIILSDGGTVCFLLSQSGYLFVSLFFFFSGYGIMISYINKKNYLDGFIKKHLTKLIIPYIFAVIFYSITLYILGGNISPIYQIKRFITDGSLLVSNSWYIIAIVVFYIIFYISAKICNQSHTKQTLCIVCLVALYSALCYLKGFAHLWFSTSPAFITGIAWAANKKTVETFIHRYFLAFIIALTVVCGTVISVLTVFNVKFNPGIAWGLVRIVFTASASVLFSVWCVTAMQKIKINNGILAFFGKISLELYLIHGLFIKLYHSSLIKISSNILYCFLVILSSVLSAYVLNITVSYIYKKVIR